MIRKIARDLTATAIVIVVLCRIRPLYPWVRRQADIVLTSSNRRVVLREISG
jgi:hypothetical protein